MSAIKTAFEAVLKYHQAGKDLEAISEELKNKIRDASVEDLLDLRDRAIKVSASMVAATAGLGLAITKIIDTVVDAEMKRAPKVDKDLC